MNFIAGLILMQIEDESLAFYIFSKVLDKDEWRNMFLIETPKLFEVTDKIKEFMRKEMKQVYLLIKKYDIYLESLFASAFMTLFTNLISMEHATRVLDRFILCKILSYNTNKPNFNFL
jgi:hypothetical protein